MDSFYKSLSVEQKDQAYANNYNFDHPNSFDFNILFDTLNNLKSGIKVDVPQYSFSTHSRLEDTTTIYGANIIIFEGIFALYDAKVRDLMDLMLFVDTDSDVRLARRLKRDIAERNRDLHGVLTQYKKYVKPAFDDYILPTMKYADVILPNGTENSAAINVIVQHITRELDARDLSLRSQILGLKYPNEKPDGVVVLEKSLEVEALLETLQRKDVSQRDFEFDVDRLSRLVVERGLTEYEKELSIKSIEAMDTAKVIKLHEQLCGVIVTRTRGPTMLNGLNQVIKNLPTGTVMLVQPNDSRVSSPTNVTNSEIETSHANQATQQFVNDVSEIELHHCALPKDVKSRIVIVSDVTMSTGAAAMMALRVVLDHGVDERNIIFMTLLSTAHALHVITNAFPKVKIVVAEVVSAVNVGGQVIEDIRHFGDRSFSGLLF
ncbi:Uridine-cytidine kinase-like 1 [Physocladia obscura]|uniref:uridine/cytidine kinase n=1 Tax=Physocladia obscura TaxID=109957 RepID=A0AAD5TBB1_9FUNG|nr:Uridine-cytidine kinase-like 1 [Physocladia obscura]